MKPLGIALWVCLAVLGTASAQSSDGIVVGIQAGAGYTAIDLPTALDWNEDYFDDWSQVFIPIKVQATFAQFGSARVGGEVGYSRLYYYYVRVPPTPTIYEKDVWVFNVSGLAVLDVSAYFVLQAAAGVYIFDNGTTFGLRGAGLLRLPVGGAVFTIGPGAEVVFGDGTPAAVGLLAGVEFRAGQ
jgi:hypothetical protein